ncbi:transcriptional regulator, partial [Vibrio parahaemolyticus]|nr:transcriptional regulator [Vibrio parahaemolyticus]
PQGTDLTSYYHSSIEAAVAANDIPKALTLLDEAKELGIEGAQEVFVKAVNKK